MAVMVKTFCDFLAGGGQKKNSRINFSAEEVINPGGEGQDCLDAGALT
jgi:hypothetical protein